jgi:hypothetical protein
MRLSIFKIILLSAILVVLVSISGGIFVNAQTETDKGPAGQNQDSSSSQPVLSSSAPPTTDGAPSTSSALDPNAAGSSQDVSANDPDAAAARPAGIAPNLVMLFKFVAGSAFHPRNSTYTYAESSGGGCIYQTGGEIESIFVADLQFPDGATVDILRQYYYDMSETTDSSAFITQYDGAGGYSDIAYIPSTGSSGYGSNANTGFSYSVGSNDHPIVLNWRPNLIGDTMRLCGMRVRYWASASSFFMPGASRH